MYTEHEREVMKKYCSMLEAKLPEVMEAEIKVEGTPSGTELIYHMLYNIDHIWDELSLHTDGTHKKPTMGLSPHEAHHNPKY